MNRVREITTVAEWNRALQAPLLVVRAGAQWCGACSKFAAPLSTVAGNMASRDIQFVQFDVDAMPQLADKLNVQYMPYIIVFRQGQLVDTLRGPTAASLTQLVRKHTQ
jgi:thioredoxin 1